MAVGMLEQAQSTHAEGRLAEAAAYYREFLRTCPNAVEALEGLGVVLYQLGRMEEATALFARGVATHPEVASLHAKLGGRPRISPTPALDLFFPTLIDRSPCV